MQHELSATEVYHYLTKIYGRKEAEKLMDSLNKEEYIELKRMIVAGELNMEQ